jgi:hypothetical protein
MPHRRRPDVRHGAALAGLLLALVLPGCASLTERQCRQADWSVLGRQDGDRGLPLARLEEHRDSCARSGIVPDEAAYRAGHAQALASYCTPRGGYIAGRRGDSYQRVCDDGVETAFLEGFHRGREVHYVLREVRELRRRAEEAELASLAGTLSSEEAARRRQYAAELSRRHYHRRLDLMRLDRRYTQRFDAPLLTEADMRY